MRPATRTRSSRQAYFAKFGDKAPQLEPDRRRLLRRRLLREGTRHQGRRHQCAEMHGGLRRVDNSRRPPDRGSCTAVTWTKPCSLRTAKAPNSRSSRRSRTLRAATSARPDQQPRGRLPAEVRGYRNGSADRHPGDQRPLRRLNACRPRSWTSRDLRPARCAQHRAWRVHHDRRLLRLHYAVQRLALSRRLAVDAYDLRAARCGGGVDDDPSALSPPVRYAGCDLGLKSVVAQDRRSDLRPWISQPGDPASGNGPVSRHGISDLSPGADRAVVVRSSPDW